MSVIACPIRYLPANAVENPEINKLNLTKRIGSLTPGRFGKHIFYGIIVCLMLLLITLSLFRYKADVYFEHGRRSLNENEITEAIHSYEMAVKYNPLSLNYNNVLNGIYLKMAAIGISKDSERNTEGMPDIFSREQTAMWFANAIEGAEQVQKLYPADCHSAFTLGQAYHLLDKMSPARLRQAVLQPPSARLDDVAGQAGGDKDMSKEAIKYYKRATTLHPFKFKYRNKLARLYAEEGRYEDAIHELKEAKSIAPSNQASYLNLAKVFMNDRERYEEAEAILLEFIKRNPDHEIIDIYRLLSYVYFKTAKWGKILSQSRKIIQLDQEDLEAYKYAIMANFKLERYDDARNLCNRILELSGSQNNTYKKYAKEMLEVLSRK
jgi:tetratricopeptide (TPR) repeat protein